MKFKLNAEGYNTLKEELNKHEGPFSKTTNNMQAMDLLAKFVAPFGRSVFLLFFVVHAI